LESVRAVTSDRLRAGWATLSLGGLFLVVGGLLVSLVLGLRRPVGPATDGAAPSIPGRAQVEVLNGSGRRGLARAAVRRLRRAGWDVVAYGNAPPAARSEVIARHGRLDQARLVADLLGLTRVRAAPDSGRWVDLTVVLGADAPPIGPTAPRARAQP